jgi:hypothetical protein
LDRSSLLFKTSKQQSGDVDCEIPEVIGTGDEVAWISYIIVKFRRASRIKGSNSGGYAT